MVKIQGKSFYLKGNNRQINIVVLLNPMGRKNRLMCSFKRVQICGLNSGNARLY